MKFSLPSSSSSSTSRNVPTSPEVLDHEVQNSTKAAAPQQSAASEVRPPSLPGSKVLASGGSALNANAMKRELPKYDVIDEEEVYVYEHGTSPNSVEEDYRGLVYPPEKEPQYQKKSQSQQSSSATGTALPPYSFQQTEAQDGGIFSRPSTAPSSQHINQVQHETKMHFVQMSSVGAAAAQRITPIPPSSAVSCKKIGYDIGNRAGVQLGIR